MNVLDRTRPWLLRIDLAREPDFLLGELKVRPSRREVEAGEVRQALQPRIMQVLVALAHPSSDVVSQDELISRCWGGLSVELDAVARCISHLRRLAASWPKPPFEIETIPGVGYRLTPSASAAPTGEALAAARPARPAPWRSRSAWIALPGFILVVAIAAAALLAIHPWRPGRVGPSASTPAIAVLGFQAADGSPEEKTLAAALQGRVADALSKYNVTVISASPGPGADFTVQGRVVQRRGRLWVTTDLTDPRSHVLVFSFDRVAPGDPNGDVASQIANHLARSLDPSMLSDTVSGKLTPADYILIARANDAIDRTNSLDTLDEVRKLADRHPQDGELQASEAIAATNAAKSGKLQANAAVAANTVEAPISQIPELMRLAHESVSRAERLPPESGLLSWAKAQLINGPMAYPEQERLWRRFLSLNPGRNVPYQKLGGLMLTVGRADEGAALLNRAVQIDPIFQGLVSDVAHRLAKAGRVDDASQLVEREEQLWPDHPITLEAKYTVPMYLGDARQILALNQQRRPPPLPGSLPGLMAQTGLRGGGEPYQAFVDYCARKLAHSVQLTMDGTCLVEMVRLGRIDEAFRLATLAYPDNRGFAPMGADAWILQPPPGLDTGWLFSPVMKPFRDDPRFWDVAVRTGMVNYWQTTGAWPDFCRDQLDSCKRLAAASALAHPPPLMRR